MPVSRILEQIANVMFSRANAGPLTHMKVRSKTGRKSSISIRFLEYEKSQKAEEPVFVRPLHKSEPVSPRKCDSAATAVIKSSVIPRSVSLSQMLKVGQLIEPETNVVTLHLEEFAVNELKWLDPFPVTISLHRKSFSEGAFREAYMAKALSGLPKGDYVLKKYKEGEKPGIIQLFGSMEAHTKKSVMLWHETLHSQWMQKHQC